MKGIKILLTYTLFAVFFFLLSTESFSQQYKLWGDLKQGKHGVGFKVINKYDYSRPVITKLDQNGNIRSQNRGRPIQISIWYPAKKNSKPHISFDEYVYNIATELDFNRVVDNKAKEESIDNFKKFLMGYLFKPDGEMRELIKTKTAAMKNAEAEKGNFPLLVLGQGNTDSPHRHAILAEYLASHGYIVATMPSSARISNSDDMVEAQARDFEFVLNYMYEYPNVNTDKISLFGFSMGGNSGGLVFVRNSDIDAFISFDSGLGSTWGTPRIKQMPEYKTGVNRKTSVLNIYKLDEQRTDHSVIEAFKYSDSYFFEMNNFHHFNFTTAGMFAAYLPEMVVPSSSSRWLVPGEKAKETHEIIANYALKFLNAYFKNDKEALTYMKNSIKQNRLSEDMIVKVKEINALDQIVLTEQEFVGMIRKKGIDSAIRFYNNAKKQNPDLVLFKEGTLNQMGYNEFLSSGKKEEAIKVFKLVVEAYPESANAYDSLGEAYMVNGNNDLAIENYKKSLELDSQNTNAKEQLKVLLNNNNN